MEGQLYTFNLVTVLLLPISVVYWFLHSIHKFMYRSGIFRMQRVPVPVIVLGNITVGGTGKTPLVHWIANYLVSNGYKPGIISRGYKGSSSKPARVSPGADPKKFGDEPVLLAGKTGAPVYVGANRVDAARSLLNENSCDVIISDDGLQHYRLFRDIEIAVVDGWRRYGNGFFLPAGPLRENQKRLASVDWILCRGGTPLSNEIPYHYRAVNVQDLKSGHAHDIGFLREKKFHAVTGIGNPDQFFSQLKNLGCEPEKHIYPDHHYFTLKELTFPDTKPLIMTEKDAVKCRHLVNELKADVFVLAIEADLPNSFGNELLKKLGGFYNHGPKTT